MLPDEKRYWITVSILTLVSIGLAVMFVHLLLELYESF
jgi:hypothetical protein